MGILKCFPPLKLKNKKQQLGCWYKISRYLYLIIAKIMKKVLLIICICTGLTTTGYAQCDAAYTPTAHVFASTAKGAGIEGGVWPTGSNVFGLFGGMMMTSLDRTYYDEALKKNVTSSIAIPVMYAKGQLKLHRFAHLTTAIGLMDLTDLYTAAGMRISIPIDRGRYATVLLEPQATTLGFRTNFGIAIAFE